MTHCNGCGVRLTEYGYYMPVFGGIYCEPCALTRIADNPYVVLERYVQKVIPGAKERVVPCDRL